MNWKREAGKLHKFEHLKNEKSVLGKIKSVFHNF